jgi:hypothetical protein
MQLPFFCKNDHRLAARAFSSEVDPVRVKKTRQNKESRAPFRFYRNEKALGWFLTFREHRHGQGHADGHPGDVR